MGKKAKQILQYFVTEKLSSKNIYRCKFCHQPYTHFNVTKMCKHLIKACTKMTAEKRESIAKTMNADYETGSSIKSFVTDDVPYNILPVSTEFIETDNSCYDEPHNSCTNTQHSSNVGKPSAYDSHFINSMNMCQEPVVNVKEEVEEENSSLCCVSIDYSVAEPEIDNQSLSPSTFERSPSMQSRNKRKSSQTELLELAIKTLNNSCSGEKCRSAAQKDVDEFDVAGQKMAFDLRNLKPEQRIHAEKLIGDVIYQGKRGKLNDYSSVNVFSTDPRLHQFPIQSNQNSCTSTLDPNQLH